MTAPGRRSHRVRRVGVAVGAIGLAATVVATLVAQNDVERLSRRNLDRSASAALLQVQSLTSAVDQVLSTANGVVAASNLDAQRFADVLGPDVRASPTLSGMALLADGPAGPRLVSTVGDTDLLRGHEHSVQTAGAGARLVTSRQTPDGYALGFGSKVARNAGAVYLEVLLPVDPPASGRFALAATDGGSPSIVLGNVRSVGELSRWRTPVSLGGTELTLFVAPAPAPTGVLGVPLPTLILVVGLALTALAVALATALARRTAAVATLDDEKRALDDALERARTVEAKLRSSEARFRSILRNTPDVIVTVDPTRGSCELLNRRELLGHPREELREPGGLSALFQDDDRGPADEYWEQLATLEPERITETTLRATDPDGRHHYVRLRFSSLARGARPPLLLGLVSDVTEATEQHARETELQEALHRSQRLEAVGQLASGVAHDFNNLLMVILGFSELLAGEELPLTAREYRAEIERAATRGSALVRQLLAFGQRDAAQPEPIDVNDVLATLEPMLRRTLGEPVQLQLVTSDRPTTVVADPVQLEQVVLNLALNARDAMPHGGVLFIAAETSEPGDGGEPERVVVSVTDTGTGIDPSVRDTMFEPFVTTKAPGKGTGLGLATVASIVDAMGGSIRVLSAPEQGTTFEVALPYRADPALAGGVDDPAVVVEGAGRRVLLVEDEAAVRSALARVLRQHGFEVTGVGSAPDALRELDAHPFDALVSDVVMPNMSGVQLAAHARADHPDLPIVLMSGYSNELDGIDADAPDTALLRKPFTHQQLLVAIGGLLGDRPLDAVGGG